jgi:mono/diheme cytochrome c family protein
LVATVTSSDGVLLALIRDGSDFPQTGMPLFGQTLNQEEIAAIIEYLKSEWGPEERVY